MTAPLAFEQDGYRVSLAQSGEDLRAAQHLRYQVFVDELGGQGAGVDHVAQLETDCFDDLADHLILRDLASSQVVGVYRLLPQDRLGATDGFYSETEYDVSPLRASGRRLLELGRSCVHRDHRGGAAMFQLWSGLARYVRGQGAEILFGVASLPGTDIAELAPALSLLHHRHLAPAALRPRARVCQPMDLVAAADLDRRAAMVALPSLIKAYLRLGGMVGQGAFVDRAFGCTDVCMVMDTAAMNDRYARRYQRVSA